jgi:hypothetical protein
VDLLVRVDTDCHRPLHDLASYSSRWSTGLDRAVSGKGRTLLSGHRPVERSGGGRQVRIQGKKESASLVMGHPVAAPHSQPPVGQRRPTDDATQLGKRGCRPSRAPVRPCGAAHGSERTGSRVRRARPVAPRRGLVASVPHVPVAFYDPRHAVCTRPREFPALPGAGPLEAARVRRRPLRLGLPGRAEPASSEPRRPLRGERAHDREVPSEARADGLSQRIRGCRIVACPRLRVDAARPRTGSRDRCATTPPAGATTTASTC